MSPDDADGALDALLADVDARLDATLNSSLEIDTRLMEIIGPGPSTTRASQPATSRRSRWPGGIGWWRRYFAGKLNNAP